MNLVTEATLSELLQKGKYKEIISMVGNNPQSVFQYWGLIEAYCNTNGVIKAVELLRQLENREFSQDEQIYWHYYWSLCYQLQDNQSAAEQAIHTAIRFIPQSTNKKLRFLVKLQQAQISYLNAKYDECLLVLKEIESEVKEYGDNVLLGTLLFRCGAAYEAKGSFSQALEALRYAQQLLTPSGNLRDIAAIVRIIGLSYYHQGNLDDALLAFEDSFSYSIKLDNWSDMAATLNNIGMIYKNQDKMNLALEYLNKSLDYYRRANDLRGTATILNNIALANRALGKINQTIEYYEQALVIFRQINSAKDIAMTLNNIATAHYINGNFKYSLESLFQAQSKFETIHFLAGLATCYTNIGSIYHDQGRYQEALDYQYRALTLFEKELKILKATGQVLSSIGATYRSYGNYQKARECFEKCLTIFEQVTNPILIAGTIVDITILHSNYEQNTNFSAILARFPKPPYQSPVIHAFQLMIDALQIKKSTSWINAVDKWREALNTKGLDYNYQMLCQEELVELLLRQWQSQGKMTNYDVLQQQLISWREHCQQNNLSASLCKVHLVHAKLYQAFFEFENAEKELKQCIAIADEKGLPLHLSLAQKEFHDLHQLATNIEDTRKPPEDINITSFATYLKEINVLLSKTQS